MRISCTNCDAQYDVDGALIPAEGREVKCSQCDTAWLALPVPDAQTEPKKSDSAPKPSKPLTRRERIQLRRERQEAKKLQQEKLKKAEAEAKSLEEKQATPIAEGPKGENKEPKAATEKASTPAQQVTSNDTLKEAFQKKTKISKDELHVANAVDKLSKKVASADIKNKSTNNSIAKKPLKAKSVQPKKDIATPDLKAKSVKPVTKKAASPIKPPAKVEKTPEEVSQREVKAARTIEAEIKTSAKKPLLKKKNTNTLNVTTSTKASIQSDVTIEKDINQEKSSTGATDKEEKKIVAKKDYAKSAENFYSDGMDGESKFIKREKASHTNTEKTMDNTPISKSTELSTIDIDKHDSTSEAQRENQQDTQGESKFWLGFGFIICFALLLLAVRYMSGPISSTFPITEPYFDLYNMLFDNAVGRLTSWLTDAKEYLIGLFNR